MKAHHWAWNGAVIALALAAIAGGPRFVVAAADAPERVPPAVVKASSFGWNATNATQCLQAALDSGAPVVVIDNVDLGGSRSRVTATDAQERVPPAGNGQTPHGSCDWIIEPVFLRSNQEVVIEDGVVVRALPGAFKGVNDCLFTARGVTNVVLRGNRQTVKPSNRQTSRDGAPDAIPTLRMERDAYTDRSAYRFSEWRHTLSLIDSKDVRISDLAFRYSGGDGIYVGKGSEDVEIRRVDCGDHYRQGISVISARNLVIADSRFTATKGTPPQCGIDFEPNKPSERLVNCVIENCDFDTNASGGMAFYLPQLDDTSEPISIVIRNCRARGNASNGLGMVVGVNRKRKPVKGTIIIEDCLFAGNGSRAASVGGVSRDTASVLFRRTLFDARGGANGGILISNTGLLADAANVSFEDCKVVVDANAENAAGGTPVEFTALPGVGIESLGGTLRVERGGVSEPFDFDALAAKNRPDPELRKAFGKGFSDWRDLRPVAPDAVVKTATPMCRGKFTFLQYLPREGEYTLTFRSETIGTYRQKPIPVQMRDMSGTDLGMFNITAVVQKVTIKTSDRNLRRFEIDTRGNSTVSVFSPYPGQGLLADTPVGLFRENCRLWFPVPDGAGKALVSLVPEEPAEAKLLDSAGAVVASMPFQTSAATLEGEKGAGICSIDVNAEEDVKLRIGGRATPIFATEASAGLVLAGTGL